MAKSDDHNLPVSELSDDGIRAFEELLVQANGELSANEVEEKALEIASNPEYSTVLVTDTTIDTTKHFETRGDVAEYIGAQLEGQGLSLGPSSGQERVWSWLGLVYLRQLCREENGTLKVLRRERYILSREYSEYYRHLVAFPVWVCELHTKYSRIFLCQRAYIMPDIVESVASRFDLISCKSVVRVIDHLYWDEKEKRPKKNAVDTAPPGQPALPGTVRALDIFLSQLGCTHDLRSMSEAQILAKLPAEFSKFIDNNTPK